MNDSLHTKPLVEDYNTYQPDEDHSQEFTEVFSWGSNRHGQLGLGEKNSQSKLLHMVPRFCSYNVPIASVGCGSEHTVFLTMTNLVYAMGSNLQG